LVFRLLTSQQFWRAAEGTSGKTTDSWRYEGENLGPAASKTQERVCRENALAICESASVLSVGVFLLALAALRSLAAVAPFELQHAVLGYLLQAPHMRHKVLVNLAYKDV
jgi:hypothetical protein